MDIKFEELGGKESRRKIEQALEDPRDARPFGSSPGEIPSSAIVSALASSAERAKSAGLAFLGLLGATLSACALAAILGIAIRNQF